MRFLQVYQFQRLHQTSQNYFLLKIQQIYSFRNIGIQETNNKIKLWRINSIKQQFNMEKINRNEYQAYPQFNLSTRLLKHQQQMLKFLMFTSYDIILQTFQLKHASYLNTKRGHPVQNFKSQEIARHFGIASQKLHTRIMRDDIDLDKKLSKLELLWHSKATPYFHRYYFEKYLFTTYFKSLQSLIDTQQKLIRQQKHIYFPIFKTINARESCLRQLKKNLAQLNAEDVYEYLHVARERFFNEKKENQQQKYLKRGFKLKQIQNIHQAQHSKTKVQFFSDNFNHLTKLTLYTIDIITKWKQYIYSLTHDQRKKRERVQYYFYDDNYYLKILSDTSFIKVSFLNRFFKFAPKNDPFLLWPILAFQKQQNKSIDHELLKKIFMPQQEQLSQILNKIESLSDQYKFNIRSRKNYDINVLRKPVQIDFERKKLDEQNEPVSNLILKKIQGTPPRRTKSFKTFRVRQQSSQKINLSKKKSLTGHVAGNSFNQKDKILIQFKLNPKKKATWLPGAVPKTVIETDNSPLKNSVILERNKTKQYNQMDGQLLKLLKKQVVRKIRQDFDSKAISSSSSYAKDQALEMYINNKINDAVKGIFPYQPQKQLKKPIQITSFRIKQEDLNSQISIIVKSSMSLYSQMQYNETQLLKKIDSSQYVYFVRAIIEQQSLGTIIVTLDESIKDYKALKTLFVGFKDTSQLEILLFETFKFFQKYQNSFQFIFPFFQPVGNDKIKNLLVNLQNSLKDKCFVASKQIYSNIAQVRFIFKRQHKNVNFYPNKFPNSLHFKLSLLHSEKKMFLQTSKIQKDYNQSIYSDFLLAQLLKKLEDSQNMNILKEKVFTDIRFKGIMKTFLNIQKGYEQLGIKMKSFNAQNISQMNNELVKKQEQFPFLELSDIKKQNSVHLAAFSLAVSLPYKTKSIVGKNNQMYFKISIRQQIMVKIVGYTAFYKLKISQNNVDRSDKTKTIPDKYLVLFDGSEYKNSNKKELSTYLNNALSDLNSDSKSRWKSQLLSQLWIPMHRYPQKYKERQDLFLSTHRLSDLKQIKRQLFVGQFFEWFCDLQMQNGIIYQSYQEQNLKNSVMIENPLGIALLSGPQQTIVYGRIFNN